MPAQRLADRARRSVIPIDDDFYRRSIRLSAAVPMNVVSPMKCSLQDGADPRRAAVAETCADGAACPGWR